MDIMTDYLIPTAHAHRNNIGVLDYNLVTVCVSVHADKILSQWACQHCQSTMKFQIPGLCRKEILLPEYVHRNGQMDIHS